MGYGAAELLGRSFADITHPADLAADVANVRRFMDGVATAYQMEKRYIHKDGQHVWVLLSISLVRNAGEPVHFISQVQDLTDRKQAEAASARLAAIVESSDDAIVGRDLQGVITSWNRGAEKIYGYTAAEMVGQSIQALVPAGATDDEEVLFDGTRRGQSVEHLEARRLTRDGRLNDVSITLSPIKDATGSVIGIAKVARDISSAKKAQAQLVASESRFRRLVKSNAQGVLFWTAAGRILRPTMPCCSSEVRCRGSPYTALNPDARPGSHVMVEVAGTGTGIPPAIRDKVFEPFYTTKEIGKGRDSVSRRRWPL